MYICRSKQGMRKLGINLQTTGTTESGYLLNTESKEEKGQHWADCKCLCLCHTDGKYGFLPKTKKRIDM